MLEQTVAELEELGFRGSKFLWEPLYQERLDYLQSLHGPQAVIIAQFVWEGGARDLGEFFDNYKAKYDYLKKAAKISQGFNPSDFKEWVRKAMEKVALDDRMNFLYCPFMKTRAMNLVDFKLAEQDLVEEVMCYMSQGVALKDFVFTHQHWRDRDKYLKRISILKDDTRAEPVDGHPVEE